MLKVWHMPDSPGSQFEANYLGDYPLDSLQQTIGVDHYKVISNHLYTHIYKIK